MMRLYYVKFSELHKKSKVGETPSLIWALIADSENKAIEIADGIGMKPTIMSSHQLSPYWR